MAQNTTPAPTSASARAVDALLADPEHLRSTLTALVQRAAYLTAAMHWDAQDNVGSSEWMAESLAHVLPSAEIPTILAEGGFTLPPSSMEPCLTRYIPATPPAHVY